MLGARPSHWGEYLELLRWLIPDLYRHARGKLIGMLALSGVGVALRAGSAAVIVLFVDAQQKGRGPELLGLVLPSTPTLGNLVLWGSAGLFFAVGAVAASYRCDRLIYDLARTYVEDRSRAVLRFAAAGGAVRAEGVDERSGSKSVARMIAGRSFLLVRLVISLLSIVLPAITGLTALVALFATQAVLTAILIPIGIGYATLLGAIQRRTMRDVERRMDAHQNSRRDSQRMLQLLERQRFPAGSEPAWLVDYPERSWLAKSLEAYRSAVFAKRRIGYLGELFQGTSLLLILLVFGSVMANRGVAWSVLMTYAVALGYAVRSLNSASGFVAAVNRSLPKVRVYLNFLRAHPVLARAEPGGPARTAAPDWNLAVSAPALSGSRDRIALRPGEPVLCLHPTPLSNAALAGFCLALANGDPARAAAFERELVTLQGIAALPERRIREYLPRHADRDAQWRRARAILEALGLGSEFDAEIGDPDRLMESEDDERSSVALRVGLRLLPVLLSSHRLIALDHDTLEAIEPSRRKRLLEGMADRIVLSTATCVPKHPIAELTGAVVVDTEGVRGIGDLAWLEAVARPVVESWGASGLGFAEADVADEPDDDDED